MNKDLGYLKLLIEKAKEAQSFVKGFDEAQFLGDNRTQAAVIMKLAVIGEISKKVSDETKEKINLPWKEISGFRDMAIHDYIVLSLKVVWATVHESLDELISKIEKYL